MTARSLVTWRFDLTPARRIRGRSLLLYGRPVGQAIPFADVGAWQTYSKQFELDRRDSSECAIPFEVSAWAEIPSPDNTAPPDDVKEVVAFLLGEAPLDGRWFASTPPKNTAGRPLTYWWRSHLRAVFGDPS